MVPWIWVVIAFFVGAGVGFLILALVASGREKD